MPGARSDVALAARTAGAGRSRCLIGLRAGSSPAIVQGRQEGWSADPDALGQPSTEVHAHHSNAANGPGYKFLVTAWSIEAAGGPKCYLGRDMVAAHDGLSIDTAGFDAVAMEIAATLMFLGVPERERTEFNDIIENYRSQVIQTATG